VSAGFPQTIAVAGIDSTIALQQPPTFVNVLVPAGIASLIAVGGISFATGPTIFSLVGIGSTVAVGTLGGFQRNWRWKVKGVGVRWVVGRTTAK
jgi:hypothetical protein